MAMLCIMLVACGEAERNAKKDLDVAAQNDTDNLGNGELEEAETPKGLLFEVPEGFKEDEEIGGLFVSEEYTQDYACIYYQEAAADERYSLLTEDSIEELMQEIYSDSYGIDTVVDVLDFHRFNLNGYKAYYTECEYVIDEIPMETVEYTVMVGDRAFSVTYMQKQDAGWKAAYAHSADNLAVRQ